MSYDMIALGRRAVACREWRWMSGMFVRAPGDSGVITNVWCDPDTGVVTAVFVSFDEETRSCEYEAHDLHMLVPDLGDPATLGCLLALVRLAYCHEGVAYTYPASGGWHVIVRGRVVATGDIEAEALVAALEVAP